MPDRDTPVDFQSKVTADLIAEYRRERILDGTPAAG
jgi:hypothetical protein